MITMVFDRIYAKSGEPAPESGYYLYIKNGESGALPCVPTKEEELVMLKKDQEVPHIKSCDGHVALYQLMMRTSK